MYLSLEESLMVNAAMQIEEISERSSLQVSPGHASSELADSKHHFSIDKSFFSVENSASPKSDNCNGIIKPKDTLTTKCASAERSPVSIETPKKLQDADSIPTITTELEDNSKLETTVTTQSNKLARNINQLTQLTLGTPVSASEVAAALLGNASSFLVNNRYKDVAKYKRSLMFEANDLSTPYNYYRCLSPSDSNINQKGSGSSGDRQSSGRMLKRQFSLDRADDSSNAVPESNLASQNQPRVQARLCKQNSAGAATDLERIEEVPLASVNLHSPKSYKRRLENVTAFPGCSRSISNESLVVIDKR